MKMNWIATTGVVVFLGTLGQVAYGECKKVVLTGAELENGKKLYTTSTCNTCHGDNGDGKTPVAEALKPRSPRDFTAGKWVNPKKGLKTNIDKVFDAITNGLPGSAMAPFAHLSEADRCALANYVMSFKKTK